MDHQFLKLSLEPSAEIEDFHPMTSGEQRTWLKKIKIDRGSRNFLGIFPALRWQLHSHVNSSVLARYVAVSDFGVVACHGLRRLSLSFSTWIGQRRRTVNMLWKLLIARS